LDFTIEYGEADLAIFVPSYVLLGVPGRTCSLDAACETSIYHIDISHGRPQATVIAVWAV
jgi:hypothetical protein